MLKPEAPGCMYTGRANRSGFEPSFKLTRRVSHTLHDLPSESPFAQSYPCDYVQRTAHLDNCRDAAKFS
jgi:hypothetical protein